MRLIDAKALLEKFNRNSDIPTALFDSDTSEAFLIFCKVADAIDSLPIIDAEPVRHGVWVPIDDEPHEDFECSACGYVSTASFDCSGITPNEFPYCPMCGAKMDGENE